MVHYSQIHPLNVIAHMMQLGRFDYEKEGAFVGAGLRARPAGGPPTSVPANQAGVGAPLVGALLVDHPTFIVGRKGGHGDPPLQNGALLIIASP